MTFLSRLILCAPFLAGQSFGGARAQTITPGAPPPYVNVSLFGTGADGGVTITSGTTTLTHDMHAANLTISGSGKLVTSGWKVYVSQTLDLSAAGACAINLNGRAGNNGSGATGGAAVSAGFGVQTNNANGSVPQFLIQGGNSAPGGNGSTGAGAAGGAGYTITSSIALGGTGGAGAIGGAGVSAGGAGGAAAAPVNYGTQFQLTTPNSPLISFQSNQTTAPITIVPGVIAGAGGSGGGDGVGAGGGGGSPGMPGGTVDISAATIARGTNATTGIICATGGTSGNGANAVGANAGGGAGAGGSGGGFVRILAGQLTGSTITNAIDVSGAAGGNGGNGNGTGKGGNGGSGGGGGNTQELVLSPSSYIASSFNAPGAAGGTTATATGATGGAGAVTRSNL